MNNNNINISPLNSSKGKKKHKRWVKFRTFGDLPSPRCSHASCIMDIKIFIFGGWDASGFLNDFYVYQVDSSTWSSPITSGDVPEPRAGHSMTLVGTRLYVFGGTGEGGVYFNDVKALDLETMIWENLETTGPKPLARSQHSAVFYDHYLFIFGGGNNTSLFNDLHALDLDTLEWSMPICYGIPPQHRIGHTATLVGHQLFIFGGNNGKCRLNDTHILDLQVFSWERARIYDYGHGKSPAVKPLPRAGHTANYIDGKIIIYGGGDGNLHKDLCFLNLYNMTWSNVQTQNSPDLLAHTCEHISGKLLVFGGSNGIQCFNDTYSFYVGKLNNTISIPKRVPPNTSLASKLSFKNHQKILSYHINSKANRSKINRYFQNVSKDAPSYRPNREKVDDELRQWARNSGLEHKLDVLIQEEITMDIIGYITDKNLQDLGFSIGDQLKFLKAAKQHKKPKSEKLSEIKTELQETTNQINEALLNIQSLMKQQSQT